MTIYRSLLVLGFLLAFAGWGVAPSISQTAPRTGTRPTTSKEDGGEKKSPVTAKVGSKPATGSAAKGGQAGPVNSAKKQNAPPSQDDEAPRTATRPNSSASSADNKSTLPASTKITDLKESGAPQLPPQPKAPSWVDKITPEERQYIDDVLKYWEAETAKITTYRCDFRKYTYNPNFAPANIHYEYSTGQIMYAKPDKGMYRVDEIHRYRPAKDKDGKPEHVLAEGEKGEHWICDGSAVFYFDYLNKILRKTNLPPVMKGKAIADGPLPFVFGAEAKKIKDRYWLHVVTPKEAKDEIRLAARPKFREDAANYQEIIIVIDHNEFLPKAMTVFPPNYHPKDNPAKDNYFFDKRENNLAEALWNKLKGEFYQPKTPGGWKLEEQDVPQDDVPRTASAPSAASKGAAPSSTQRRPAAPAGAAPK